MSTNQRAEDNYQTVAFYLPVGTRVSPTQIMIPTWDSERNEIRYEVRVEQTDVNASIPIFGYLIQSKWVVL